ncbi:NAD(P)H-dependent glycerol-3-phosphate dehydrogenase [Actinoalloteichus hymeniacidonis]|nr:NAD(P)H-dependent glycerol-3-phosphate dehydrogenase [Actinoalloteichus hymeniacidonis]
MGSGSWGTAFAKVMADAGRDVVLWSRRAAVAEEITRQHRNGGYLPDVILPDNLTATSDAAAALTGADAVVLAVPSQTLRENLAAWRSLLPTGATLVSTAKGVELGSLNRMSEVIADALAVPADQVAVLSGPNLAKEVGAEQPTATVIACSDVDRAEALQHACSTNYFRPYTNTDVIGCELGGACKNVIALACGMADGLGFGDNTTATLITRGLAETARLGATLGADPLTFAGLAGLGDLVATCSSPLSRNRTFGARMGRGDSLTDAQAATNGQVAEGVKSCASIRELAARNGVEMPITDSVYRVCHQGLSPRVMAAQLLGRARKAEWS